MIRSIYLLLAISLSVLQADDHLLADGPQSYLDLGGDWDVLPIAGLQFDYPPPTTGWKKEPVPSPSTPSLSTKGPYDGNVPSYLNATKTAFLRTDGMAAWFRRNFALPVVLPAGKRVLLRFQGMSFKSEVWLNGKKIGGSLFGQVPVIYDVTDAVHPGDGNELLVGLTSREGVIDLANQTFLAPTNGTSAGIWGKVELEFVPETRIDDVFIKTSVKEKKLSLDVTLINAGKQPEIVSLKALVTDAKLRPETEIAPTEVTLAPGESKIVTLEKDWIAPELWSPANAALYFAKVSIERQGASVDVKTIRFGFREFEIRGRDFYLNGQRIVLLRDSMLASVPTKRADVFRELRAKAGNPYNCIRLHIGFDSEAVLDLCDEMGIMALPESAWFTLGDKFRLEKRELWLPNAQAYLKALILQNRNRPSVVMWNLTNETAWGHTTPAHLEVADAMVSTVKANDPTRPFEGDAEVNWAGRLPVINIHYPESSVENALRAKYPNSGYVYPNDYHWLTQDKDNVTWRAEFKWDRPLVIGEYFYPSGDADKISAFMGDSVYDWEKWRSQRMDGRGTGQLDGNEFLTVQKGLADAYRIDGVAGLNPWTSDGPQVIPQLAVRPVDLFPNAFAGTTATRKFVIFNDTGRDFNGMGLQCRLSVKGEMVWEKIIPAYVASGEKKIVEIPIECPASDRPVQAELSIRLRFNMSGGWYQLDRHVEPIFIMPRPSLADIKPASLFLFDSSGKSSSALKALGLEVPASTSLSAGDLQRKRTLIIGEDSDAQPFRDVIADFVKGGGAVIVLRQDQWVPLMAELPEIDKEHVSTRSWRRTFDHPVTRELDDRQLSYWRPDHLVSVKTFRKPSAGRYRVLLDSGGLFGMRWSPLLEVPVGQGTVLLTSLNLVQDAGVEPAAAQLLANLVRYAGNYQPAKEAPLRLLAGTNAPLRATLTASGVLFTEGLEGNGPVLLDASFKSSSGQIATLKSLLAEGGHVWLHGFSKQNLGEVADLFPFPPELEEVDPTVQAGVVRSEDPLRDNLASFDFFWTRIDLESRADFFEAGHPTAKLGTAALKLPSLQAGTRLIHPGFLVKVPVGNGTLLFDTLAWEGALGAETDKVTRIVSALAANQGATVRTASDEVRYNYFPVDLSHQANMGYYDRVANDGIGGWTDQGRNDMRFFLINHVGKTGGLETGMDVEAQQFPSEVTMAGHKFWLLDPRKTSDRAIISLRGGEHGARLPDSAKGIVVGRKADALWFLDAAGWTPGTPGQEVARYVIHYADGTDLIFPIRFDNEIAEWWNPKPIGGAKVAWTGNNLEMSPIGIYSTEWKNPNPDKEIATIDLIGNLSPVQVVVLAITAGEVTEKTGQATLLGKWNLHEFTDNKVPNQVEGGTALEAGESAPTLETEPKAGLHFEDGQALSADLKSLPGSGGIGEGKAFSVKLTFTPKEKSPGAYAGLFEAMAYGKSGFRIILDQQMKVGVEIFLNDTPEGKRSLASLAPVEMGRTYTVEVRFDGTYATLLVDGHVDQMKEMPLPATYDQEFHLGRATGNHYFFNGDMGELSLSSLPPTK